MTWQKVVGHINDRRIMVENKSGIPYPVETEYEADNEQVYTHMVNSENDWDLWADVDFSEELPTTDRVQTGDPDGGPPEVAK